MAEKYYPLAADYQAVVDWCIREGFTVRKTDPARLGAGILLLVYLAGDWRAFRHCGPEPFVDAGGAAGAAGFVVVGLAMLAAGGAFLENLLPLGTFGKLTSGGEIPIVNWCVGLEVCAAFVLLFLEFLEEVVGTRKEDGEA